MAPEVIARRRYTEKADVYSFGILLGELYTTQTPYSQAQFRDMFSTQIMYMVLNEGLRPAIPEDCPLHLKQLIERCVHAVPENRPSFNEIEGYLQELDEEARGEGSRKQSFSL